MSLTWRASCLRAASVAALPSRGDFQCTATTFTEPPGDGEVTPAALAPWNPENADEAHDAILLRTEYSEAVGMKEESYVFFDPEPVGPAGGTYWFRNEWSRPDRGLLSAGMLHPPGIVFATCSTGASEVMGGFGGRPISWRSDLEEGYSDHLPLILEFEVASN